MFQYKNWLGKWPENRSPINDSLMLPFACWPSRAYMAMAILHAFLGEGFMNRKYLAFATNIVTHLPKETVPEVGHSSSFICCLLFSGSVLGFAWGVLGFVSITRGHAAFLSFQVLSSSLPLTELESFDSDKGVPFLHKKQDLWFWSVFASFWVSISIVDSSTFLSTHLRTRFEHLYEYPSL